MEFVDKNLVKKAKQGNQQALTELILMYNDKIFNLAYRMLGNIQEAEDVSQETFLKVYSNLDKYDENYKFSTWIFRIATNLCIDRIRKKRVINYSMDQNWDDDNQIDWHSKLPSSNLTPEEEVISNEEQNLVHQAILNLPPKYRVIMSLRYVQDLSVQEISEIVNLSVATIKTRLHRGREYLRKQIIVDRKKEGSGHLEMS